MYGASRGATGVSVAASFLVSCLSLVTLGGCKSDPAPAANGTGQTAAPSPELRPAGSVAAAPTSHAGGLPQAPEHGAAAVALTPRTLDKLPDGRVALGPFSMQVPTGWSEKASTTNMRTAQFQLPANAGEEAEVIVYHFGEAGAGSIDANIDRWLSQFQQPDGKSSRDVAKIEKATFAGGEATLVSVSGRYVATPPGGGQPVDKADQSLVAAIIPSPRGPYYFRMIGSASAVQARAPEFQAALASLKVM